MKDKIIEAVSYYKNEGDEERLNQIIELIDALSGVLKIVTMQGFNFSNEIEMVKRFRK